MATILFDLSEVLISGLVGAETAIAPALGLGEQDVLRALGGESLRQLCLGKLTEDQYLDQVKHRHGWKISNRFLKSAIRANFHRSVLGMPPLLEILTPSHRLILFSDHAREWIAYIRTIHPFLALFEAQFFSFQIGYCKDDPEAFQSVLAALRCAPSECVFVDDNPANIATAASLGIPSIQFTGAERLAKYLARQWPDPSFLA